MAGGRKSCIMKNSITICTPSRRRILRGDNIKGDNLGGVITYMEETNITLKLLVEKYYGKRPCKQLELRCRTMLKLISKNDVSGSSMN
jgi:hypothetical protein